MQEFLYNEEDRKNNPPVYDTVFENDPSGVFGSLRERIRTDGLGITMTKLMAVNLCLKDSVLFDSDFFDRVMNKKQFHQPLSAEILFSSFDVDIYEMLMERGILYRDKTHLPVFSQHKPIATRIARPPQLVVSRQTPTPLGPQQELQQATEKSHDPWYLFTFTGAMLGGFSGCAISVFSSKYTFWDGALYGGILGTLFGFAMKSDKAGTGLVLGAILGGLAGCSSCMMFDKFTLWSDIFIGAFVGALGGWIKEKLSNISRTKNTNQHTED